MTTDTAIKTPQQILSEAEARVTAAQSAVDSATQAFNAMSASGMKNPDGSAMTTEQLMKVASDFTSAPADLAKAITARDSAKNVVKLAVLDGPMTKVRDGLVKLLTDNGLAQLMLDADAGTQINITATFARDPNDATKLQPWAINRKFASATVQKAADSNGSASGGNVGTVSYEHNGKSYTSRELIAEFSPALIADGTLAWSGDPLDATGLTHRADVLAGKLGATKSK